MDTLTAIQNRRESSARRNSSISPGSVSSRTSSARDRMSSIPGISGGRVRRYSCVRNPSGVAPGQTPSPLVRVRSSTMQYNGPHCMDIKDDRLELKHGMHKDYTLRLKGHIRTVLYNPKRKTCTVFHSEGIHRFIRDEQTEEHPTTDAMSDINNLLHASDFGVYVGVCKHKLKLLGRGFNLLHQVDTQQRITAAVFNSWSGEMVTACPGHIMVRLIVRIFLNDEIVMITQTWVFRQGAKVITHSLTFSVSFCE